MDSAALWPGVSVTDYFKSSWSPAEAWDALQDVQRAPKHAQPETLSSLALCGPLKQWNQMFANLIIDVRICLPPSQVVPENGVCWVADSTPVEHRRTQQCLTIKEVGPQAHIACAETGRHQGDELAAAPFCVTRAS